VIIDLSHTLDPSTPVYPGDPPVAFETMDSTSGPPEDGRRRVNLSALRAGLHAGTHLDAPFHFFGERETVDRVPLDHCVGTAVLARIEKEVIEPRHLQRYEGRARGCGRIVINTGWHHRWGMPDYFEGHPVLSADAARLLVEWGVVLVGVDTPSVDREPFEAHVTLLNNDILIVENLTNLDAVDAELFTFAALPLKLGGRDGSPVRAVALDAPRRGLR
jgi:kynurenine formamidase